jgi:hypothetical protein
VAGLGGAGVASSITGSSETYGAGGDGGTSDVNNANGTGGGNNTGKGGGAGSSTASNSGGGGAGGSGIVIVRYLGSQRGTGGTVSSSGGYTIHTFASVGSGTYTA